MNEITKITEPLDDSWLREPGRSEVFQRWMHSLGKSLMRKLKGKAGQFTSWEHRREHQVRPK